MVKKILIAAIIGTYLAGMNVQAYELSSEESNLKLESSLEEMEESSIEEANTTTETILDQYKESLDESESYEEVMSQETIDNEQLDITCGVSNAEPLKSQFTENTKEMEQTSKNILKAADQLTDLQEGELVLLSQITQLAEVSQTATNTYQVAYAINEKTGMAFDAMIYRYNGTNHSYILNENVEVTDEIQADFKNFIKECYEDGSISAARAESEVVTITAEAFYTDTYIEGAGTEHTGTWGVRTLLEIEPIYASTGEFDIYTIHAVHRVYPYAWTKYVTTYYSHGINIYHEGDTVTSGTPSDNEINLNQSQKYSFAASFPPGISVNIDWNGNSGTKMKARRRDHQHDIVFTNNEGVFGTAEEGNFQYETYTTIWGNKRTVFTFYYNEALGNAVYGNGKDFHMYGDKWIIVTPNFNHSPSTDTGFVWEGRDYSCVFNPAFYLSYYQDLRNAFGEDYSAAFQHFINHGMSEGRQAITSFNVYAYMDRYADLRQAFGTDLVQYYHHYIDYGYNEGRLGIE